MIPSSFFQSMDENITKIRECLWQIEDSLTKVHSYLRDAKEIIRKIEEKQK